jgi:hypothetical protein
VQLCHIDVLAEAVWQATKAEGSKRRYRESLRAECAELGYAWDVHDIHKHGKLEQRVPMLPNGRRPQVVCVGKVFQRTVFQGNVFQVGKPDVVLTLEDGAMVRALDVIKTCVQWWDAELHRLGWSQGTDGTESTESTETALPVLGGMSSNGAARMPRRRIAEALKASCGGSACPGLLQLVRK